MKRLPSIPVDWPLACLQIRRHLPLERASVRIGMSPSYLNTLVGGLIQEPGFSAGVQLLDLHAELCGPEATAKLLKNPNLKTSPEQPMNGQPADTRVGQVHHRLTIEAIVREPGQPARVRCRCECGKRVIKNLAHVISGNTKSCGCMQKANRRELADRNWRDRVISLRSGV